MPDFHKPNHPAYEDAIQKWKSAGTHRLRAMIEERLWNMASPTTRHEWRRRDWLRLVLDEPASAIESRGTLLNAPEVVWDYVDAAEDPLTLGAATRIVGHAKKDTSSGLSLAEIVARDLASGAVVRKSTFRSQMEGRKPVGRRKGRTLKARSLWKPIREAIAALAADRIPVDAEEYQKRSLHEWLEREMDAMVEAFSRKILHLKKAKAGPPTIISRRQVVDACRTLMVDPPRPGEPVDLAAARRAKLKLVRAYHPDAHGGSEQMRDSYEAVVSAFETLEKYAPVPRLKTNNNGGSNNGDGNESIT